WEEERDLLHAIQREIPLSDADAIGSLSEERHVRTGADGFVKEASVRAKEIEDEVGGAHQPVELGHAVRALPRFHPVHRQLSRTDYLVVREVIRDEVVVLVPILDVPKNHPTLPNNGQQWQIGAVALGDRSKHLTQLSRLPVLRDVV